PLPDSRCPPLPPPSEPLRPGTDSLVLFPPLSIIIYGFLWVIKKKPFYKRFHFLPAGLAINSSLPLSLAAKLHPHHLFRWRLARRLRMNHGPVQIRKRFNDLYSSPPGPHRLRDLLQ
ncbi:unnamed protein product, partial [Musa hybrid cultivar]